MENLLIYGALFIAGYYYLQKQNPDTTQKTGNDSQTSIFPLKLGDSNIFVKNIQSAILNKGGIAAELILKAGGATGNFNENTQKALRALNMPVALTEKDYRNLINNTLVIRNYAYVKNTNGTKLYANVGNTYLPGYGYGRDEIIGLPYRTYLGIATGNYKNDMLEIGTTINTQKIKFWVFTKDIVLVSKTEYEKLRASGTILEKSDKATQKLLNL